MSKEKDMKFVISTNSRGEDIIEPCENSCRRYNCIDDGCISNLSWDDAVQIVVDSIRSRAKTEVEDMERARKMGFEAYAMNKHRYYNQQPG